MAFLIKQKTVCKFPYITTLSVNIDIFLYSK